MKTLDSEIDGSTVVLAFNYKFLRLLGGKWDCAGPMAVHQKFSEAAGYFVDQFSRMGKDNTAPVNVEVPFDKMGVFADILLTAAQAHGATEDMDQDVMAEWLVENISVMPQIIELYMQAMPVATTDENAPVAGKTIAANV